MLCCFEEGQNQLTKAETKFGSIENLKLNKTSTNLDGDIIASIRRGGGNTEGTTNGKKTQTEMCIERYSQRMEKV